MSEIWSQLTEEGIIGLFRLVQDEQMEDRKFLAALQGVSLGEEKAGNDQEAVKSRVHKKFTPPPGAKVTYVSADAPIEELRARGIIGRI